MTRPSRVWRRMIAAMTANSSADIGMTRSRSVLDGAMTLADAEMGELQQFLNPDAAVSQDLDGSPFPEGEILGRGEVQVLAAGEVTDPDVGVPAAALPFLVSGTPAALIGTAFEDEGLPGGQRRRLLQEAAQVVVTVLEVGHERGEQGLALADPVVDPFFGAPLADREPAQGTVGDRAGRDPRCPHLGLFDRPAVQVE